MPTVAGLCPGSGHTERVEGTSGRGAGVFRDVAPLCVRYCQQAANSMLACGDSHPEGRTPRPAACRSAEGMHISQETVVYFCILDNGHVLCV